jgi:hypothetical protein
VWKTAAGLHLFNAAELLRGACWLVVQGKVAMWAGWLAGWLRVTIRRISCWILRSLQGAATWLWRDSLLLHCDSGSEQGVCVTHQAFNSH